MASSGRPVSSPTFSYGSSGPPCVAMTAFIVSTTRRTLSVSVPSRSQRTARSGGPLAAATARGRLRCGLPDRARELPAVELLAAAVALQDLDAGGLAPLKGGESLLTPVADPPPPDGIAVLGLPRVDDAGVGIAAGGALHRHKIWDR